MVRFSQYFISTFKEEPSSSDIISYSLSLRSGLIKKIASGVYSFMPMGLRVLKKIEKIVREEMDRTGAVEMLMPALQPSDLWMESERWNQYGPELFRLKDRNNREFCLGPTHEELVTSIVRQNIRSYKDMPVNLYQIQVKFRDEIRPRYGMLRAREFVMKDAYSFSANEEDLDKIYQKMFECYSSILKRLQLNFFAVEADSGLIGGKYSHEFIILAKSGEDKIAYCPNCGYSANFQMVSYIPYEKPLSGRSSVDTDQMPTMSEVYTPGTTSIKALAEFLKVGPEKTIKTMILKGENRIMAFLLRGDRELNIEKAEKFTGIPLEMIEHEEKNNNLEIGYLGPVGLDKSIEVFADISIRNCRNMTIGANKQNFHFINANQGRDFTVKEWGDFSFPETGDLCHKCKNPLKFDKGIEIGHIFKLGTKYSKKMNATYLDSNGNQQPIIMGCYGIGISRIISAVIEQLFDSRGIIWPLSLAPFLVNLVAINIEDENIRFAADQVYETIKDKGIEVIYDDRNVRAGVKFKDSDLIGIPLKLIIGKNYTDNKKVEIETRKDGSKFQTDLDSAINFITEYPFKNSF
jgi:prolyl-tRNA synthetase